uniref:Reverse transcriptase domain-containing protein n=1 Tax=Tanacetum cinerariifolium TaxID=118510 RepID=A0A6L2LZQ1_TANCI|nr:reverse transcriptase domain-containing protein [Tanacetum cinerariifolium]
MTTDRNGDPPVPDLRTMEELCQPTLNGQGGPIGPIAIQATNFGLKKDMFDRLPRNSITTFQQMAKMFLGKYFPPSMVTKLRNEITNFRQHTFYNGLTLRHRDTINAAVGGTFMKRRPEECYDLIGNMTAHHNNWDTSVQLSESSSSITSSSDLEIVALKAKMAEINKNLMKVRHINQQVKAVTHNCETCGGPHSYNDCPATVGQTQNVTKDTMPPTHESTKDVQPSVVQIETPIPNSKPIFAPVSEPIVAPNSALKPNQKPSIPYPSRLHDQKLRDKTNDHKEKFFKIFQDLNFNISFADALILMPKPFDFLSGRGRRRCLRKSRRALINVYEGELTLRVGKEAVTFNLDQTLRYSANYDAMSVNRFDLIAVSYEEYSQEVLRFSVSGNPTPSTKPIGDILLLEEFLNDDPSSPPIPLQERKVVEPTSEKSSINEPPVVELKDLPTHLEYAFLEGNDKLPVIIAKDFKDEEKTALIKVLKSHTQALAWQLSDIKGIVLEFYTHKILMKDDFKLAVQHQRRVNLKIHEVIKKEVLKLLDAKLIYPILDSPWVSPVHCVPKKGGFTVVENEENELIPTRLVTGLRVCIDYQKLNDATCKNHFPLPFMDQMLERLAGNEYYCFLDGFSVFRNSFGTCLSHLEKMLKWCEDTNLCLNWEKSYYMVKEGIILGHKISKNGIVVDKAKVDSSGSVFTARKPLIFSRLATIDPPGDIMARTTPPKRQVKVSNHGLKRILERTVGENRASWSDKLDDAHWAFRTASKTPIGCTLYKLVYGKAFQINELNKLCDQAYENSLVYKEETKRIHDSKIKDRIFNVGDRVLLFNFRLNIFSGKLMTRWSGPFTITIVFPYGTVELSQIDGLNFKVNGHRLKNYFGEGIPKMVVPDLQTFPKDQ